MYNAEVDTKVRKMKYNKIVFEVQTKNWKNSVSQVKSSVEKFTIRMIQVVDRISGLEERRKSRGHRSLIQRKCKIKK